MSNEREQPRQGQEDDARVSGIYRETATERTPERLNRRILAKAAHATQSRYARSIHWTRPLAWAATIVLCLTITLQVTRVPAPDSLPATTPAAPLRQESVEAVSPVAREQSAVDGKVSKVAADAPDKDELDRAIMTPATTSEDVAAAHKRAPAELSEQTAAEEGVASGVAEFELRDTQMLRRADELVKVQIGEANDAAPASARALTASSAASAKHVDHCDEEARETAESWLSCIESLEQAGLHEAARQQREQLAEAFPDFEMP